MKRISRPSTIYNMKYRWLKSLAKADFALEAMRHRWSPGTRVFAFSAHLYSLGIRGEQIYDAAWDARLSSDWLWGIGDYLGAVEEMSEKLRIYAEGQGITTTRVYLNLKCPARKEVIFDNPSKEIANLGQEPKREPDDPRGHDGVVS